MLVRNVLCFPAFLLLNLCAAVEAYALPASQTITFPVLPAKALGDADFALGATASSGLPVTYSNSNEAVAQIVDGAVHIVGAGTAVITARQPGTAAFAPALPKSQTLTVKMRLTANVPDGGGMVAGAGLYVPGAKVLLSVKPSTGYTFLRWEDGSQATSRNLVTPGTNVTVSAWFGVTSNVPPPVIADPGARRAMVGVPFTLPLDIQSASQPSVTLTGLPMGLSYSAATKSVTGVPAVSVTNKVVMITAKNASKTSATMSFMLTVDPLPGWAQGSFNGAGGTEALGSGAVTMSVTAKGEASGKVSLCGTNFSFSTKSYTALETNGVFTLVTTAKVDKVSLPLVLSVGIPGAAEGTDVVPQLLSKADGVLDGDGWLTLYRNVWKDAGMAAVLTNGFTGYYTATLPGGSEYGSGYLAFTVDKAGVVKVAGKLADGTAVSLSGTMILDESGRCWDVLYTAPSGYKGGSLFGVVEFIRQADGPTILMCLESPFVWASLNPTATGSYGEGFYREISLTGGWYDTIGNLYRYYADKALTVGVDAGAAAPQVLATSGDRYESVWWDPSGLALSVVTNKSGVLTGLAAPKAMTPAMIDYGVYDYENATNTVGLTMTLTRSTGLFKGSFKAWFDTDTAHASKSVSYEGILIPENDYDGDGATGRGFFLWADKADPTDTVRAYSFSWSYDFRILLSE